MVPNLRLRLDYSPTKLFIPKLLVALQTFPKLCFSRFRVLLAVLYVIKYVRHAVSMTCQYELKSDVRKMTKYNNSKIFGMSCLKSRTKRSMAQRSYRSFRRLHPLVPVMIISGNEESPKVPHYPSTIGSIEWYPISASTWLCVTLDPQDLVVTRIF